MMALKIGRPKFYEQEDLKLSRIARRLEVARMVRDGVRRKQIAEALNVPVNTVRADITAIKKEWIKEHDEIVTETLVQAIVQLDGVMAEYWQAWYESKQPEETVSKEFEPVAPFDTNSDKDKRRKSKKSKLTKRKRVIKQQCGNPSYLQGVERCIEKRCKLLGVEPPQRIDANIKSDTAENWMEIINAMNATIGTPDQQQDGNTSDNSNTINAAMDTAKISS